MLNRKHPEPPLLPGPPPVGGSFFYGIPNALWGLLKTAIPEFSGPAELTDEVKVAGECDDFSQVVGLHNGRAITYDLLIERKPARSAIKLVPPNLGWELNNAQLQNALDQGDDRLEWAQRTRRAYCGWLMTNPTFLQAHDDLFKKHAARILEFGCVAVRSPALSRSASRIRGAALRGIASFRSDMDAFCQHWQLKAMAGPYLPVPFGVHAPVTSLHLMTPAMMKSGTLVYLPHIFALPGENELRSMLDHAQAVGRASPHLTGWFDVVSTDRPNKGREMDRYGRVFEIQHFLRLLNERYPAALKNNKRKLMQVFAARFGFHDVDSVKDDFKRIADAAIADPYPSSGRT